MVLFTLILLNGFLQLSGIGSIFPFFALLTSPERISGSQFNLVIHSMYPNLGRDRELMIFGMLFLGMLCLCNLGALSTQYFQLKYAFGVSQWLRERLLHHYAAQPYSFYLKNNSAILIHKLRDIHTFTNNILLPIGDMLFRLMMVLMLGTLIVWMQPKIGMAILVVAILFYLIYYHYIGRKVRDYSGRLGRKNKETSKISAQFFNGIKEIILYGNHEYFISKVLFSTRRVSEIQGKLPFFAIIPRYLLEIMAGTVMVVLLFVMDIHGTNIRALIPNLTVVVYASYRLLISFHALFGDLVQISSHHYTIDHLDDIPKKASDCPEDNPGSELDFRNEIRMENITFRYPHAGKSLFEDFSVRIKKNEFIGIAGPSGVGKSTLIDLLLGFQFPTTGLILVDDNPLTESRVTPWRKLIGYVPQDIYLMDESIASNIAFGEAIADRERLIESASKARILDFIGTLGEGFETPVGERGIRLSGGQRQRIGIARALYRRPEVLILDEATSSLDQETEKAVMETLQSLRGNLTILLVSHRPSTLNLCDRVITL